MLTDAAGGNPQAFAEWVPMGRIGQPEEITTARRRDLLEEMNTWRNAIAHHNFDPGRLAGRTTLTLGKVRNWRSACQQLARTFNDVMKNHLQLVTGTVPW